MLNDMKPMPKLAAALAFLASLLLIVSLLFTALQLVMHDETWFAARYEAYGTAGEIGIPTKDITAALMQLIDYMEGDVASIDLTVMENGIPVSMYNERETLHMIDVRELYQAWRSVRDFGVPAARRVRAAAERDAPAYTFQRIPPRKRFLRRNCGGAGHLGSGGFQQFLDQFPLPVF